MLQSNDDYFPCDRSSYVSGVAVTKGVTYYIEWDNRLSSAGFYWTIDNLYAQVSVTPEQVLAIPRTHSATLTYGIPGRRCNLSCKNVDVLM